MKKYTIAETFAGAGGNHIGWKMAGFNGVYINDFDQNMLDTITYNNPELKEVYVDKTSIIDIKPKDVLKNIGMKQKELDVLFGGIVCKGFSLAGERNPLDERNYFYHAQLKLVKDMKPKVSVIENVSGILSANVISGKAPQSIKDKVIKIYNKLQKNKFERSRNNTKKITKAKREELEIEFENLKSERVNFMKQIEKDGYFIPVIKDIEDIYSKLGYKTHMKVLKSTDFGVASIRKRVFIVAIRNDLRDTYKFPVPFTKKPITVRKAIEKIKISENDQDSLPMNHTEKVVKRFSYIPEGKNIADVMGEIPMELRINKFFSRGSNMRLAWDKPAPTLVPGHSAFPLHPKENRSITVREAAAITGFPNKYKFFGNHSKRCEQVGNAIPPKLAEAVANSVKELLDDQ